MQLCTACSTTTEEAGRFCPECGAVLTPAESHKAPTGTIPLGSRHQGTSPPPVVNPVGATAPAAQKSAAKPVDPAAETTEGSIGKGSASSLVGHTVDGFAIEGVLGGGAFGTVYRGRQIGLEREVAIKVPTYEIAADPIMCKRFAREAKSAARVHHPGVVAIHQVGELTDGRPFLALELVECEALDRFLADGPIPVARALRIARQIASALSDTHAVEVVHRDLKPTNVMWRQDRNGDDRITLVDFGIAVCKPGNADATRLTAGGLIGTPHYMSPEQAHGEQVDARADLYALGCLLFELVTGTTPFDGSGFEVLLAHLGRPAPRASERNPDIPESVDQLLLALMAKRPDDRILNADAVVARIDETLDTLDANAPTQQRRPKRPKRPKRATDQTRRDRPLPYAATLPSELPSSAAPRSHLRSIVLGAAVAFAISGAGFAAYVLTRHDPPERTIRREIFLDAAEMRLRLFVPEPMVHSTARDTRIYLELRNKLGQVVVGDNELIVSVTSPDGAIVSLEARRRSSNKEQYAFVYRFTKPGAYRVQVLPSALSGSFDAITLDVK
ncbi:MAG: serine/threonine-protein kinase [Kofleriaceae bacterium]